MRELLRSERTPVPEPSGARGTPALTTDAVAASAGHPPRGGGRAQLAGRAATGARSPPLSA
jgi:hypothetical protein